MALDVTSSAIQFNAVDRGPERLSLNVFNGRPGITIFSGNGSSRLMSQSFSLDATEMLKSNLIAVRDGQPGTTKTLVFQKWDTDAKKYITMGSLVIGKDDRNVCYWEAQFNSNGTSKSIRFDMKASAAVTTSTDDVNPALLSSIRLEATISWFVYHVPFLMAATLRPYTGGNNRPNSGGGNSGGGNNSGGNSGGGDDYSGSDASF